MISPPLSKILSLIRNNTGDHANIARIRLVFRSMAVVLGLLHTYAAIQSQSMNADGIAYLDIGDAYFRGDWGTAISTVWSPLYSWILGGVNFIVKPSMQWEFPAVQLVNLAIYLFALISFEYMWGQARQMSLQPAPLGLPDSYWWMLGYLLFVWTSLSLIQIWSVTPDMLMAAFLYLAAGQIAQIRTGRRDKRTFLLLGLVLGLGYLSKAFMFYISLIFLALAWLLQKRTTASAFRTFLSIVIFLLVSGPFILLISFKQGKLTISEAGMVTYVRHVTGIPYPHWQGDPLQNLMPAHPSRLVHRSPSVYEFGGPIGGTYPISTDPAYWYEGLEAPLDLRSVFTPLFLSGLFYIDLFFRQQGMLLACVIALYALNPGTRSSLIEALNRWALIIPAIVAFGLYALVLVANRYIGSFVLLFWTDLLANIRPSDPARNRYGLRVLSSIAAIGLLMNIVLFNLDGFKRLTPSVERGSFETAAAPARPLAVAEELKKLGVDPGEKVGVIGYAYDSYWARLARLQIVAEMLEEDAGEFWYAEADLRSSVLRAFEGAGVSAVVAEYVPARIPMEGWHQVGNSNYYIYVFEKHD